MYHKRSRDTTEIRIAIFFPEMPMGANEIMGLDSEDQRTRVGALRGRLSLPDGWTRAYLPKVRDGDAGVLQGGKLTHHIK